MGLPPLLGLLFATPLATAAVAVGIAAVPIVIHLLNRKRHAVVAWAAMRFLLAAQKRNVRRLRLEQWLLLASRVLIGVLLVAAMAAVMPWAESWWLKIVPGGTTGGLASGRTHRIIVLDASFTMKAQGEGGDRFALAKEQAREVLERSAAGDGFSLIVAGGTAQAIVPDIVDDARRVADEIDELRLPHGTADTAGALRLAADMAGKPLGKYARREVVFITDLKRSGWSLPAVEVGSSQEGPLAELARQANVVFIDVARNDLANIAISGLTLADPLPMVDAGNAVTISVTNHGRADAVNLAVELRIGKAPKAGESLKMRDVGQKLITLKAGATQSVVLPLEQQNRFREAGDYVLQARAGEDALKLDNVRALPVTVRDAFAVLVVNGSSALDPLETPGEWVRQALQPTLPDGQALASPIRATLVGMAQFADRFRTDLSKYECVILCDPPALALVDAARLESYLQRGGRVVLSLGPNALKYREEHNRLLTGEGKGILPGPIVAAVPAGAGEFFTLLADDDSLKRPPLNAYKDDRERASLSLPPFHQYIRLGVPANVPVRRVLSFLPNRLDDATTSSGMPARDPAVLDFNRGRGRVIVFTSTFNPEPLGNGRYWSNWAPHPTFLPFLHETVRYLVTDTQHRELIAGETLDEYLPLTSSGVKAKLIRVDDAGETLADSVDVLSRGDTAIARFSETFESGIYRVNAPARADSLYAVNVPVLSAVGRAESDLTRLTLAELQAAAPESVIQLVNGAADIASRRGTTALTVEQIAPRGTQIAHWLLLGVLLLLLVETTLAWWMGSVRAAAVTLAQAAPSRRPVAVTLAWLLPTLGTLFVLGTWGHALVTNDLLGYLPPGWRQALEQHLQVPQAAPGEGNRWRLAAVPYVTGSWNVDRYLVAGWVLISSALAVLIYRGERVGNSPRGRRALIAPALLRIQLLLLTLLILLPQVQLQFEREAWPDVVLIIDDSRSMARVDEFIDPLLKERSVELRAAWVELARTRTEFAYARIAELQARLRTAHTPTAGQRLRDEIDLWNKRILDWKTPHRLNMVKALLASGSQDWLQTLVRERSMRVHVYRASAETVRIAEVSDPEQCARMLDEIIDIVPEGESSRLGDAVAGVLKAFRGRSLCAIVLFSDGQNTEGEELSRSAALARRKKVPLLIAGIGEGTPPLDLGLADLRAERESLVRDRLIFNVRVTARGQGLPETVPVTLYEIVDGKRIRRDSVSVPASDKPIRLSHTPETPGDKLFAIEVPVLAGEPDVQNNRIEHEVHVAESRRVRVLLIDEQPRYEFRFLKTLFEREAEQSIGTKSIDLNVLLMGADREWYRQDKTALAAFPGWEALKSYDVVILGDVDPKLWPREAGVPKLLADFVKIRGGGLLLIAGEHALPAAYADTELAEVLPVAPVGPMAPAVPKATDPPIKTSFRPLLTTVGANHPIFRFVADDADNVAIWNGLMPLRWFATGYARKRSAEVLAVHPDRKAEGGSDEAHPLVLQQFVGNGRVLFLGFDETWLWRHRQDERRYNQFWLQAVRSLARTRVGRVELSVPARVFRRNEPIRVSVRFPEDAPAPAEGAPVVVRVERRPLPQPGMAVPAEPEIVRIPLNRKENARASYEALLSQTADGEYQFILESPAIVPRAPRTESTVLPPRGESDEIRLNETDLRKAAGESGGQYAGLDRAGELLDSIPDGQRVVLDQPCPPLPLWNQSLLFGLMFVLLLAEWLLRKRARLL